MLQTILLVVMILISIALTGVILLQKSEGGALGMGGGPSGFMTARGAGNLLSQTTAVLAVMFFLCAISLTIVGNMARGDRSIIDAAAVGSIAIDDQAPAAPTTAAPTVTPIAPSLDDLEASLPTATAPGAGSTPSQAPGQ